MTRRKPTAAVPAMPVATIGYEGATVRGLQDALRAAGVELLVDVRAVAMSRRPGFAKTALAANVREVGIDYLHLRGLGTPADGRAAARAGQHDEMQRIFAAHMTTDAAREALHALAELVRAGRRTCLLCFEADAAHCHRTIVANALAAELGGTEPGGTEPGAAVPITIAHLRPLDPPDDDDDDDTVDG